MISVKNLSKSFGEKVAVNHVTFQVQKGEVLGFLGPNGAGKSTTMRMIVGFTTPTSGSIHIDGLDIQEHPLPARRKIGYLPEHAPAYADMTVQEFLAFAAELRGLHGAQRRSAVGRAIETCFLESVRHQSIDTLSKGYRHRTCLAQSIIHDPEILILDEPTDGLDPNQKHEIRTLIRDMRETKCVIFSTHILEEVEAACTRAVIIDRGQIVANGTPAELKARDPLAGSVLLTVAGQDGAKLLTSLAAMEGRPAVEKVGEDLTSVTVRVLRNDRADHRGEALSGRVLEHARQAAWKVTEVRIEEGRLDNVFRRITLPDTVAESASASKSAEPVVS